MNPAAPHSRSTSAERLPQLDPRLDPQADPRRDPSVQRKLTVTNAPSVSRTATTDLSTGTPPKSRHDLAIRESVAQYGVISRQQLLRLGFTDSAIQSYLRARRFARIATGVYATFTGELTVEARWWAAVLRCGPGSFLYGGTALSAWGLLRADRDQIEIAVPSDVKRDVEPWIRTVRIRAPRETRTKGDLQIAAPADALIDATESMTEDSEVLFLIIDSIQQNVVLPRDLNRALVGRRIQHRKLFREALALFDDGRTTALEFYAQRDVLNAHDLPPNVGQAELMLEGVRQTVDLLFAEFGLVVELDGKLGHSGVRGAHRDMARDNRAAVKGMVTLRFGWNDVRRGPCRVALQIAEVLIQLGWAGIPRVCSRGNCSVRSI